MNKKQYKEAIDAALDAGREWGEHEVIPLEEKRAGDLLVWPDGYYIRSIGGEGLPLDRAGMVAMRKVGKKKAGRELDGVLHDAMPEVQG